MSRVISLSDNLNNIKKNNNKLINKKSTKKIKKNHIWAYSDYKTTQC